MPKSYSELTKQIEALQKEADELRRKEASDVIARIKEAIEHYGLRPEDLFGRGASKSVPRAGAGRPRSLRAEAGAPRYADGQGNFWGGRGPRPKWLRDALASGTQLSDFEVKVQSAGNGAARAKKAASKTRRGGVVKYRDAAGNTWSGVGPRPRWFKEALATGKTPEDLAA